jgi:hypothetical protein
MPKPSPTDRPNPGKPSALELFTDRVSEQELLAQIMAPHSQGQRPESNDFLTVFYGVGGVGKTTLCRQVRNKCLEIYPEVAVVRLNLDSPDWTPCTSFAQLLATLVHELSDQKVLCPLTHALLLMYYQAGATAGNAGGTSGLWAAAVSVLDQTTQAVGIPGIGLVIQGAQWLRDRKRQLKTRDRLEELGLWPEDEDGQVDRLDLEEKLARALYEDLKDWTDTGKNLRIMIDGFERIQGRENKLDCQKRLQRFAGYIAASEAQELKARIRIMIFGRDKLCWDELYDDSSWNDYWNQHMLAGLGERDAREFLRKHADWLSAHGQPVAANAIHEYGDAVLNAADERVAGQRLIYPYYLDLAVTLVCQAADEDRKPDLGKTPSELQDRFFRYLVPNELLQLKILAMAVVFDAPMFDALVRDKRISGYAVGTFLSTVVHGRSYVSETSPGHFRFHRLMEEALWSLWMKSHTEKVQGCDAARWLLAHLESRIGGKERKDWREEEITCWRRGVDIIVTQGYERAIITMDECQERLGGTPWNIESLKFPVFFDVIPAFHSRIHACLKSRFGYEHPLVLASERHLQGLLFLRMLGLNGFDGDLALLEKKLEDVVATLTERERTVIEQLYGLNGGGSRTLEVLARQLKETPERMRQIEAKALRKMRHPTRIQKLSGFLWSLADDQETSLSTSRSKSRLSDGDQPGSLTDLIASLDEDAEVNK